MDSTSADRRVFEKTLGVAMLSTMVERREHFHFSMLAEAMTQNAALTQSRLASMIAAIQTHVPDLAAAKSQALARRRAGPPRSQCHGLWRRFLDHRRRADF